MKNIVKLIIIKILRNVLKIFYIFPVKENIIMFESFEGRQFSDNPKYLYTYMLKKYGNKYQYVWVLNCTDSISGAFSVVKFLSFAYFYRLLTSKIIISNLGIEPFFPKRKNQFFVNTWHGSGAYKSQSLSDKIGNARYNYELRDFRGKVTDYYISGCKKYSEVMSESWNSSIEKFLSSGTPRNDIFFDSNLEERKQKILKTLNLSDSYGYVLFAPTFRGSNFRKHSAVSADIDIHNLLKCCEKRFNKPFKLLFRAHVGSNSEFKHADNVIDVTTYPDMQEVLIASDILITDYSSSMWDYSFLKRPGFLYISDFEVYLHERDFYTPIETWPFPSAKSNEELQNLIMCFDENENNLRIQKHLDFLGNYETGNASRIIAEKLGL